MDPAGARDTELAWQLLTMLIRLGHPAAASELAAAAAEAAVVVSPQLVERLCSIPGSPLRFSGGVVTASETAIVTFQRFTGWDFPAPPRVSWKGSKERKWCGELPIRYERKRKASDARRGFGVKRHLLMESDANLVEHKQQQLTVQSCFPVPTADVCLEDMQDTLGTCIIVEPSKSPNGVTLVPSESYLQPELDQFLGGSAGNELGNISSALVPMGLSIPSCVDIPFFCVEKTENIHAAADNESSRIGEPEEALSLNDCRVEDSDDQEKESILPVAVEAALVGDTKVGIEENIHAAADNDISRIAEPEGALPLYNCRLDDSDDQEKESIPPIAVEAEPKIKFEEDDQEEEEERAQSTSSSPAICPSPETARIAMNKLYAQLVEERRLRQENSRRQEAELLALEERMEAHMMEMMRSLYATMGQTLPQLTMHPSAGSNQPRVVGDQESSSNAR